MEEVRASKLSKGDAAPVSGIPFIDDFGAETPAFMQGRKRRSFYG